MLISRNAQSILIASVILFRFRTMQTRSIYKSANNSVILSKGKVCMYTNMSIIRNGKLLATIIEYQFPLRTNIRVNILADKRFNVNCIVNKLYLPEEADRIRLLQRLKLPLISLE